MNSTGRTSRTGRAKQNSRAQRHRTQQARLHRRSTYRCNKRAARAINRLTVQQPDHNVTASPTVTEHGLDLSRYPSDLRAGRGVGVSAQISRSATDDGRTLRRCDIDGSNAMIADCPDFLRVQQRHG
jgi:hypothetical protein